jgi:DNA repair photolyase
MEFVHAKSILSGYREDTPWFGINYNFNIYRGCNHGCIYCDSRSECYRVEDFDRVRAKQRALVILEKELRGKRKKGVAGTGAMSDPYNPLEKKYELTRGALTLLDTYGFGAAVCTKSDMVVRDADLLLKIAKHSPVLVKITVTTADDALCRKLEPGAPPASARFRAIRELSKMGIFTGVLMMPLLPFIEDNTQNILDVVRMGADSGARFIFPAFGVTLRQNQRDWFFKKLDESFAGIKQKYVSQFGNEYACNSSRAKELYGTFKEACNSAGVLYRMRDIVGAYRGSYSQNQISFFE